MVLGLPSVAAGGTTMVSARLDEVLASGGCSLSFEFFPPKTAAGSESLLHAVRRLEPLSPTFVSVTYGAGGSTRSTTIDVTRRIAAETTLTPVGHLTCVGSSRADLRRVIGEYAEAGVGNVMALRGDPPTGLGTEWTPHPEGLQYADELVTLLRELGSFCVGVAAFPEGHPESPSLDHDAQVLRRKQDAGASFAVTQLFFRVEDYLRLRDRAAAAGATLPIIPGVMPLTSIRQIERFGALSGTQVPDSVTDRLHAAAGGAGDTAAAVRETGIDLATELCRRLQAEGVPGLHFDTLNTSTATLEISARLGLSQSAATGVA